MMEAALSMQRMFFLPGYAEKKREGNCTSFVPRNKSPIPDISPLSRTAARSLPEGYLLGQIACLSCVLSGHPPALVLLGFFGRASLSRLPAPGSPAPALWGFGCPACTVLFSVFFRAPRRYEGVSAGMERSLEKRALFHF
jgi:hypothetical protein